MSEGINGNERRFQEISSLLEQLINSQKHLLQAQVILSDRQDRSDQLLGKLLEHQETTGSNLSTLTVNVSALAENLSALVSRVQELAEGQKHTDERLNALIAVVDELVRRGGKPGPAAPPQ
jgi:DNA repair exonuclease SbcCD ATPase subunit